MKKNIFFFAVFILLLILPAMAHSQGVFGDVNSDGMVDILDLNLVLFYRNQPAWVCPSCDLDGDGMITGLDARKVIINCTCFRCICQG